MYDERNDAQPREIWGKRMNDKALRVMTLSQILEKIHSDDIAYYRRILKRFKQQSVIADRGQREMDPHSLARYIVSSGDPFGNIRIMDYSVRYICNVVSSYIIPMQLTTFRKKFQEASYARALNDAIDACLLFRISVDLEEYIVVPAEYRFIPRSSMKLSSQLTLDNALMDTGKVRLKEFLDSVKFTSLQSTSDVFLKGAVYSYVINEFDHILSQLQPEARRIYDQIVDLYGVVSSGEILQLMDAHQERDDSIARGRNDRHARHDSANGNLLGHFLSSFLLLTARSHNYGTDMAYVVPDELMLLLSMEKLSGLRPITNINVPRAKDEDYSLVISVRNFLIASYYLELHGKRRTTDKLTSILSINEETLTFLDSFCRHSNFIYGSNSTYHITQAGIDAMSDLSAIERINRKYISDALSRTMFRSESSERNLAQVESFLYNFLKSSATAYSIPDIKTLIKWNPENSSTFRQKFLEDISQIYYWKGRGDIGGDIRKRVLDMADGKMLNSAVKHLAGLGVIKIVHEESKDGTEVVMAAPEDNVGLSAGVDSRKLKNYMAKNITRPVVQSNFEVIVSPLEDFQLIKNMVYGCELISASTGMVFRMTEMSLRFYANNLGDLNEFLALLAEKSAHAIPENVSRTVRDIGSHSGEVTVRRCAGILVFRDNFLMRKAMSGRAFSKINIFEISDNVLGVTDASDFEKIGKTLGDAGLLYRMEENGATGSDRMPAGRHRKRRRYSEDWEDSLE